jgi:isoamylase
MQMDAKVSQYSIQAGQSGPLGATLVDGGVNFAVFSAHAERIELCLFDPSGTIEMQRITLPENTHEIFHGFVPGLSAGALYGFRAYGPFDPENGHRFNPNKLLADPYARAYYGTLAKSDTHFGYDLLAEERDLTFDERDNARFMPKCRVLAPRRQTNLMTPKISWPRTMIYETHVKGFTKLNPDIPEELRGTFEGLGHKAAIDYIKSLGITSVELMPVHEFFDDFHLADNGLTNYWGYNTFGFFAPASRYFGPAGRDGFVSMVRAYHDAGIEVILDVVYNHTAEGNELGPTLSFKGLDNFSYYRTLSDQHRYYVNDTGTGNTLNTSHPRVLQMVMDSLRYWVEDMEVDGFRFDLGTILGREPEGFDQRGGFFDAIMQDPALAQVKLIGEPWDIGPGGYQVGGFPPGWAEWNDKYRDSVREYWKGDEHTASDFAARILGSGDYYDQRGRRPWSSVNFITAHDGFTLGDLVSYDHKHNEANGEHNKDGHDHNRSHNYGAEGPTDDPEINDIRERQKRNFLATLFFSHGTPMLLAGDEIGHSQSGNNNCYCQDNELTWLNWGDLNGANAELLEFTKKVIALRNAQPLLRRENWRDGMNVNWFTSAGGEQLPEHWHDEPTLCLHLERKDLRDKPDCWAEVLMIFNPQNEDISFNLPDFGEEDWSFALATAPTPLSEGPVKARKPVLARARSFMLFHRNGKA